MNTDKIDQIVEQLEKRAKSYNLGASFGFFKILIIFAMLGLAFYSIGFPEFNESNLVFGVEVAFNLTLKLSLVIFAFYYIKLQMAVVAYNVALSNDLFAKAEALTLYSPDGNITLKELYEHLNVNNHKFSVKNEFSGNKELESLLSILKKQNNELVKSSNK
ncbi:hypothetical protein [Vibrio cholerae]|uniref:hypothetical protein n=3 Tax=Vibrio cholerae TaxID=666 RepID=UPI0005114181|nr:hypothetical protein [Vibrio cholerae]EGQ8325329.1 hypothetical protein [Vibrio cholerae]EGQ9108833.1 hypothetical protein [Vibrio cholerae]EGR0612486.1 hypothetical protein [Vibrio cholerae]EJL3955817.1 hypothetical protein [Vibrio cholerae]EJL6416910.1 hypothetical protein [Vibrio cholerae]